MESKTKKLRMGWIQNLTDNEKNKRRVYFIWKKKKMKQLIPFKIMRMSKED